METNSAGTPLKKTIKQGSAVMRAYAHRAIFYQHLVFAVTLSIALPSLAQEAPGNVVGTNPYPFDTVDPREEVPEAIELPESVLPMLKDLSKQDIELLKSGRAQEYTGGADGFEETISEFTPAELQAWVDAIRTVLDASVYKEGRDLANIPLNTDSENFNAWRLLRPRSLDPEREAGPISLGRYNGAGGPQTFGGFPLALSKEDLIAGEVDVAILGAPLNMGSGWRDSGARATAELRLHGRYMSGHDQYVHVNGSKVLNIVDYGDAAVDNLSTERSMEHVRSLVREIAETGAVPMIVGGDHSLSYPNVAGLADV